MKELYIANYKILVKEIEEDTNKWIIFSAPVLNESILLKCLHYPKQSIDSVQSLPKYLWYFSKK